MTKLTNIIIEDLRAWFGSGGKGGVGGGGWDRYNSSGDRVGKCGDADKGDAYSACLSKDKAAKLGKDGRAAFVKRKRAAQNKGGDAKKGGEQSKGQKAIKVKTGTSEAIVGNKIVCDNCGWSWKKIDGGDDLYICHACGHDNTPIKVKTTSEEMTPQQYQQKGMPFKGKTNVNEAKQVGIIYHYTTFEAGLKILQSNQLKSSDAADSINAKPVFAVSFTRDKRFHDNHVVGFDESSIGNKPQLRFTIDGNNLSKKFKVQPYSQGGAFSKNRKGFESEERVVSSKPFTILLSDYLMSVDVLLDYKKTSDKYDILSIVNYEMYAPLRAKIIKFAQSKNLPINLIVNKNGDPWPDKVKDSLIQKILNWFNRKKLEERLNLFLEKNTPTDPTKWAYYKSQAKKKFDVYPSAYANGWAAKKYKAAGGGWKKGK